MDSRNQAPEQHPEDKSVGTGEIENLADSRQLSGGMAELLSASGRSCAEDSASSVINALGSFVTHFEPHGNEVRYVAGES